MELGVEVVMRKLSERQKMACSQAPTEEEGRAPCTKQVWCWASGWHLAGLPFWLWEAALLRAKDLELERQI